MICGPAHDLREVEITLPLKKEKLGVFVSGGLDSAILYFMIIAENIKLGNIHDVIPFTVIRKEGSSYAAVPVIQHVHSFFNLPFKNPLKVGDNTLEEPLQVSSGMIEAYDAGIDKIYAGLIEQLPQHLIGWHPTRFKETERFRVPFKHLNKSHIVDLIIKHHQECFFHITHSCCDDAGRCNACNGCNEKAWGFEQMNLLDPGCI